MGDRVISIDYELVNLFGKLTLIDSTAFRIAVAKKSLVSFSFGFRNKTYEYDLYITDPIDTTKIDLTNKKQKVFHLANLYSKSLEEMLEKYPHQWFNFYNFWSTPPNRT